MPNAHQPPQCLLTQTKSPLPSKTLESYDEDSSKTIDYLLSLPTCTGRIGSTGMCLGGHLALRASVSLPPSPPSPASLSLTPNHPSPAFPGEKLDPRISASVCYFPTDIHSRTLGPHSGANTSYDAPSPSSPHTLDQLHRIRGEVSLIFGVRDTHVPDAGRDLIRQKLRDAAAAVPFSFHEFAWAQHAFIRDELSKGRYDPAVSRACFELLLELFGRVLRTELGEREGKVAEAEHVC